VTPAPLACGRPDVVAATLRALEPELPALAQQQGVSGTVDVVVTLDASSRIVSARIAHSPSVLLDAAALAAARGSVFRTETRGCVPIPAEYLFRVDFVGA
jgi:TonB family protein